MMSKQEKRAIDKLIELAENIIRYQALDRRIRRRISEICEPMNLHDCKKREFFIRLNLILKSFEVCYADTALLPGLWYMDTREHAEQILDAFRKDLLWYFTQFKDRMDG